MRWLLLMIASLSLNGSFASTPCHDSNSSAFDSLLQELITSPQQVITDWKTLGSGRAYQLQTSQCRFVLRIGSEDQDIQQEYFFSNLLDNTGISTPDVNILWGESAKSFARRLPQDLAESIGSVVSQLSIVLFQDDYRLGEDYLKDFWTPGHSYAAAYVIAASHSRYRHKHLQKLQGVFESSSAASRNALACDFHMRIEQGVKLTFDSFKEHLGRQGKATANSAVSQVYRRIPKKVKNQLLDIAIVAFSIGITDFHSENWMINKGNEIIIIDLAERTELAQRPKNSEYIKTALIDTITEAFFSRPELGALAVEELRSNRDQHLLLLDRINLPRIRQLAYQTGARISLQDLNSIAKSAETIKALLKSL